MDKSIVSKLLATDAEEAGVIGEIAQAKQIGVQGVPCFIFNQKICRFRRSDSRCAGKSDARRA